MPGPRPRTLDNDTLMQALRDACLAAGGLVTRAHVAAHGPHSPSAYIRRWGTWRDVLVALHDWTEQHDPGFVHRPQLPRRGEDRPAPTLPRPTPPARYGGPINFRGILHAPVGEAGVIMLFGALAHDLGFAVERVTAAFPDCEAKRRVGDAWERTRIEFEYQSANFAKHGHDPAGCDLIVCWEHNWPECPLEVLELKTEIAKRM